MKKKPEKKKSPVTTPVTVTLTQPIEWGQQTKTVISELTFRPPRAGDLRMLPLDPGHGDMLDLAARLCGKPSKLIDKLCMHDMQAVLEAVSNFT